MDKANSASTVGAAAEASPGGSSEGSNTKRIVILGKTGAGKSSMANTIFGKDVFNIDHSLNSGTRRCQVQTGPVHDQNITLIDTPGFFDTDRPEEELKSEIVRCITECAPGPHAFLIVLKVEKFTEQEQAVINKIQEYFSEEAFKYATVLFTLGDQLPVGQKIENYVQKNKPVSDLVKKCGGRCHVVDNKHWKEKPDNEYRSNKFQVKKLLNTLDNMVTENNGSCYTNEMLQAVEEEIQQEEEQIRPTSGNMLEEEIREKAKGNVFKKLLVRLAGIATGALLGALCGVSAVVTGMPTIQEIVSAIKGKAEGAAAGGGTAAAVVGISAVAGAVAGGVTGYHAAEGAETPKEAAERAADVVINGAQAVEERFTNILTKKNTRKLKEN